MTFGECVIEIYWLGSRQEGSEELDLIANVKVMKGHPDYFRVRIGDYRLGLKRIDGGVKIIRFLSRGDIYRKFP